MFIKRTLLLLLVWGYALVAIGQPANFSQAKVLLKEQVYHDQNQSVQGTLYCGCQWEWTGASGGRADLVGCGYGVRRQQARAERIEWEHTVPAWVMGHQRRCWQDGGRRNCVSDDPVFRAMEADMHNLSPSVGEVNGDRSNYRFSMLPGTGHQHGACDVKVDFGQRAVEPRDRVKGQIARVYFYIHDRYDLTMSRAQQQLFLAWNRQFPASEWEHERERRIAAVMGHSNPFVTGERQWSLGHRNTADSLVTELKSTQPDTYSGPVRGNRNSKVYHLPRGCPGYGQIADHNRVEFPSSSAASAAGYRRAGNCR